MRSDSKCTFGAVEYPMPHVLGAIFRGRRDGICQTIYDTGGRSEDRRLSGGQKISADETWVGVDKGEVWIAFSEFLHNYQVLNHKKKICRSPPS